MKLQNFQLSIKNDRPKVKVCGLTQLDQIRKLVALQIDFLGFIFYKKSPRFVLNYLTLEEIKSTNHHGKVGVFVNENLEKIVEIAEKAKLNFIQLHGDESEKFIIELREKFNPEIAIIKVIRVGNETSNEIQKTINNQPSIVNYLLFDTDSKAFGGTGKLFDWNILNDLKIDKPYFLSGGISEENINQLAIIKNQPFALDINSKFEIEAGNKNLEKIKKFVDELSREATD